jgi:hypothetical protein
LLKENIINIYLASLIHASQVVAYPYLRPYKHVYENCINFELKTLEYGCLFTCKEFIGKIKIQECKNNLENNLFMDLEKKHFNLKKNNDINKNDVLYEEILIFKIRF